MQTYDIGDNTVLYMSMHEVADGTKEITLTFKEKHMDEKMLAQMLDFVLDIHNEYKEAEED